MEESSSDRSGAVASGDSEAPTDRVSTLRGAEVQVNIHLLGRVFLVLGLVALLVVAVLLFVAGAHKNSQIDELRQRGVPVTITVTRCLGQLGGSGSNAAGYSCDGTFTLAGTRYRESIPGNTLHGPGTKLQGVSVLGDPALVTTAALLRDEHSSAGVYVLPIVLSAIWLGGVGFAAVLLRKRASNLGP
jgi:hypothetical protein